MAGSSLQIDGMALPFSQLDQPGPSVDPPPTATSLRLRSDENEGKGRECDGLSRWSQAALAVVRCAMQLSGHLIRDIHIDNHPYMWYLARLGVQSHVTALCDLRLARLTAFIAFCFVTFTAHHVPLRTTPSPGLPPRARARVCRCAAVHRGAALYSPALLRGVRDGVHPPEEHGPDGAVRRAGRNLPREDQGESHERALHDCGLALSRCMCVCTCMCV